MNKSILRSFMVVATALGSVAAYADDAKPADAAAPAADAPKPDAGPWSLGGSLDFTTDYRFRGVSQTFNLPAVQGEFDLKHSSGFYGSLAGQNVSGNEYPGGNAMETDIWGGYSFEVAKDVPLDFGLYQYAYFGSKTGPGGNSPNTTELYADITYAGLMAKLSYGVSDFFGVASSKGSWYGDLTYNYDFTKEVHFVAHLGHQHVKWSSGGPSPDYTDYKIGASLDALSLNWGAAVIGTSVKSDNPLFYAGTNVNGGTRRLARTTLVLTMTKSF